MYVGARLVCMYARTTYSTDTGYIFTQKVFGFKVDVDQSTSTKCMYDATMRGSEGKRVT